MDVWIATRLGPLTGGQVYLNLVGQKPCGLNLILAIATRSLSSVNLRLFLKITSVKIMLGQRGSLFATPVLQYLKTSKNAAAYLREPSQSIHTTVQASAGGWWRRKKGLPLNANAYGVLTDGPDYSFLDGRPTPAGSGKIKRAKEQKEIAEKIIRLSNEVDWAIENHKAKLRRDVEEEEEILSKKLKPKGGIPPEATSRP